MAGSSSAREGFMFGAAAVDGAAVNEGEGAWKFIFPRPASFSSRWSPSAITPSRCRSRAGGLGRKWSATKSTQYVFNRSAVLASEDRVHEIIANVVQKQHAAEALALIRDDVAQRLDAIYGDWAISTLCYSSASHILPAGCTIEASGTCLKKTSISCAPRRFMASLHSQGTLTSRLNTNCGCSISHRRN